MPHIFLMIAILAVSTSPLLIRLAQPIPPLVIAASRVLMAGTLLGIWAARRGSDEWPRILRLSRRDKGLLAISGLALAAHFASWISSLALTSTTASVSLVATQPIFAGVLGYLVLKEGFRRQELIGIALAGVGTLVLAGGELGGGSSEALLGDGLALVGAFTVPIYLLVGRHLRDRVPLAAYLSVVNLCAGTCLLLAALAMQSQWRGFSQGDYLALVCLALGPSIVGHTLLNYCVRFVPVHLVSLGILVEPIAAALSTWAVFGEIPSLEVGVGGAVIVLGVYAGFGYRPSTATTT